MLMVCLQKQLMWKTLGAAVARVAREFWWLACMKQSVFELT